MTKSAGLPQLFKNILKRTSNPAFKKAIAGVDSQLAALKSHPQAGTLLADSRNMNILRQAKINEVTNALLQSPQQAGTMNKIVDSLGRLTFNRAAQNHNSNFYSPWRNMIGESAHPSALKRWRRYPYLDDLSDQDKFSYLRELSNRPNVDQRYFNMRNSVGRANPPGITARANLHGDWNGFDPLNKNFIRDLSDPYVTRESSLSKLGPLGELANGKNKLLEANIADAITSRFRPSM